MLVLQSVSPLKLTWKLSEIKWFSVEVLKWNKTEIIKNIKMTTLNKSLDIFKIKIKLIKKITANVKYYLKNSIILYK